MKERIQIRVEGIVQGVGFRPFVYDLAKQNGLAGFVRNDSAGVIMEVEGERSAVHRLVSALRQFTPPSAFVERIICYPLTPRGDQVFTIVGSDAAEGRRVLIAPDVSTCEACLTEPPLSLSVYQLHQLRAAFYHRQGYPLRSPTHDNECL